MPNKWTFKIGPIAKLLREEMTGGTWLDPYAGKHSPATIRNDINPKNKAEYHMDALSFMKGFDDCSADGVLLDPPYSYRQISDCYKSLGLPVDMHTTQSKWYVDVQKQIRRILKPGGKVISCAWNSNGINDKNNFKVIRVLLIAHGSHRNDTIVTVQRKMNGSLF
jgi:hypothetical protein